MYKLVLKFDHLIGVEIEEREFNGKKVPYLCLPMEINGINICGPKKYIRWGLWMVEQGMNPYGQSHRIYPIINNPTLRQKYFNNGWYGRLKYFGYAQDIGKRNYIYKNGGQVRTDVFENLDKE